MTATAATQATGVALPPLARELIDRPEPGVLTTIGPDGSPRSSVMWLTRDGDVVLLPTKRNRAKVADIERDPRVSLVVYDRVRIERYVQLRGVAELTDERAATLVYDLAETYTGTRAHTGADDREDLRVVIRVVTQKAYVRG